LKGQSTWFSNAKGHTEILLVDFNSPEGSSFSKYVDEEILSVENSYVKFSPTGYLADVGQTTIPFIDTTAVEPRYLVPLSGVGLYYKATTYFSGYIAPKLSVYDFEPHIQA